MLIILITLNSFEFETEQIMSRTVWLRRLALGVGIGLSVAAQAADVEMALVIKDHKFEPTELKVPAGQKLKLMVHNQDKTAEEFESKPLKREKIIPPGAKIPVLIGPLKPGRYEFVGEYHEDTAHGVIVVE
jgi:plastocyanin